MAGSGNYNRVNNMQKAARIVCEQYGGDLPADWALRVATASATSAVRWRAIAFGIPVPAWTAMCCGLCAAVQTMMPMMTPAAKKAFTVRVLTEMPKGHPGP